MTELSSKLLQQLLSQARFAPDKQKLRQVEGCENLVRIMKPGQSYPFEFVCYHLTGYRRPMLEEAGAKPASMKGPAKQAGKGGKNQSSSKKTKEVKNAGWQQTDKLLSYNTLLSDLPKYADAISRSIDISIEDIGQKVYTVESLAKHLSVCGKTIRRWRGQGLIGRHIRFADGRKRLGFLNNTVQHFVALNKSAVNRSKQFSRASKSETDKILRRLAQWAYHRPELRQEALRRTAKRFGRSIETIRTILARSEDELANFLPGMQDTISQAVTFGKRADEAGEIERIEMAELFEQGVAIKELMARFSRSRASVYRAVSLERARQLSEIAVSYVPATIFERPGSEKQILTGEMPKLSVREKVTKIEASDCTGSMSSLDAYMRDIGQAEVLSGQQESELFCKYNFLKYLAAKLQDEIDLEYPQARVMNRMRRYLAAAEDVKHYLIKSNLRLVVSVARKHTHDSNEMMDLIGEGNATLLRAVEKFDFTRGFKFSTYATWAIVKRFATLRTKAAKETAGLGGDEKLLDSVSVDRRVGYNSKAWLGSVRESLITVIAETLGSREAAVIKEYYGFDAGDAKSRKGKSFRQIGELLGLSKERIRQIEKAAMAKLREVLTGERFEAALAYAGMDNTTG